MPAVETPPPSTVTERLVSTEKHRTRAKLAGWYRRAFIIAMALAVIKVFEAAFAAIPAPAQATLHSTVKWIGDAIAAIPASLSFLSIERTVTSGPLLPLERFVLALGMLVFATRQMVRSKLIDSVYVRSSRWNERSALGLVANFLALMLQAGLLAWCASVTKTPDASDGLCCGIVALMLLVSAVWLAALHLMAGHEFPELTKWMLADLLFGFLILVVVVWPDSTWLWTRAGATSVLFVANSIAGLYIGATFIFARQPPKWWWHKPAAIVVSAMLVGLLAVMMACSR